MIRELEVIREPRGISWQNWTVTCKDALIANGKYLLLALVFIGAAIGGTLYVKHVSTGSLANHGNAPSTSGEKVNLNTQPGALPNAAAAQSSQSASSTIAKSTAGSKSGVSTTKVVAPACNVAAQTAAKLQYTTNLTAENTYHTTQLTLLGVTGVVGSLLGNPNAAQIKVENARHQNVLNSLQATQANQLAAAHC